MKNVEQFGDGERVAEEEKGIMWVKVLQSVSNGLEHPNLILDCPSDGVYVAEGGHKIKEK